MKFQNLKRYVRDDYPNAPIWFSDFIGNLNSGIDTLNGLLRNLDIDNNLLAERQVVSVSHNVPVTIKLRKLTSRPTLVRMGYAAGYIGVPAITKYNSDGTLQVTIYFLGTPPTGTVLTSVVLEP